MKNRNVWLVALMTALSVGVAGNAPVYANGGTDTPVAEVIDGVEADLQDFEVEIVVDWLESKVNTPAEIAAKYKKPNNRYKILQAAIRRGVPVISELTEAFYGSTNGVVPKESSQDVIHNPAVTVPSVPGAPGVAAPKAPTAVNPVANAVVQPKVYPGEAEYQQGVEYEKQKNDAEAFYYYKLAADKMHPIAADKVAWMYYNGNGATQNNDNALAYFKISANGGYVKGEYDYGWFLVKEFSNKDGVVWLKKAAEHKNPDACYVLGEGYNPANNIYDNNGLLNQYRTSDWLKKDKSTAINYYRMARDTNTAAGYYYYGLMYYEGKLTQRNYAEAVKWFTKSYDMGYQEAKDKLIYIYRNGGYGVNKDMDMVNKLEGKF